MKRILLSGLLTVSGAIAVACQPTPPVANQSTPALSPVPVSTTSQPPSFDEALYLFSNPDVATLIKQGKYTSGLEHYEKVGQTAKKANGEEYESFFTGSSGNDTVQGFGKGNHAHFMGVKISILPKKGDPLPLKPESLGQGEMDVLVGTPEGSNEFLLGSFITSVNPKAEPFYVGKGDADYARIQNFTKTKDVVILAGDPKQYTFKPVDGNVHMSTAGGDLVAIVEGIDKLEVGDGVKELGIFVMK